MNLLGLPVTIAVTTASAALDGPNYKKEKAYKLTATGHGRAAGPGTRAGQSPNGIFAQKRLNFS